jgi:Ran GTPase-activating protein (RanGAP) involved in mRNA processing and transport
MHYNQLGVAAGSALGAMLGSTGGSTVRELSLYSNSLGPAGGQRLAAGLRCNRRLESLDLGSNRLCDPGARALATALQVSIAQCLAGSGCPFVKLCLRVCVCV